MNVCDHHFHSTRQRQPVDNKCGSRTERQFVVRTCCNCGYAQQPYPLGTFEVTDIPTIESPKDDEAFDATVLIASVAGGLSLVGLIAALKLLS